MPDDIPAPLAWLKWSLFLVLVMAVGLIELVVRIASPTRR